jgi:flagellar FliJ protein
MRFHYPLQKIVDLKGSEKSMAEWEYAASLGRLRAEEEKLSALARERAELERRMESAAVRPVPLADIHALQRYLDWIGDRIAEQTEGVRQAREQTRQRQDRLLGKMVDEKAWLNARDKAFERFRQASLRQEQAELDEIAVMRAAAAR